MMKDTDKDFEMMWNQRWLDKTPQERTKAASLMFMSARKVILNTMPPGLSEQDQKRYIYERTYGEPLPEDFFDRKKNK